MTQRKWDHLDGDVLTGAHIRGCRGNEYECVCGYDDAKDEEIIRLRSLASLLRDRAGMVGRPSELFGISESTVIEMTIKVDTQTGMISGWSEVQGPLKNKERREHAAERDRLRGALKILYEETAGYIRINNLGPVHHNRSMQMARDALGAHSEICPNCGVDAAGPYCDYLECPGRSQP